MCINVKRYIIRGNVITVENNKSSISTCTAAVSTEKDMKMISHTALISYGTLYTKYNAFIYDWVKNIWSNDNE